MRSDITWVFNASEYSASVDLGHRDVVRLEIPQMEATTAKLFVQVSEDGPEVDDSAATFRTLTQCRTLNGASAELSIPASAAAATRVAIQPSGLLTLRRCRLLATDAANAAVAQVAQEVVPVLREL